MQNITLQNPQQIISFLINRLQINTKTWTKDTHGLFDYQTQLLKTQKIKVDLQKFSIKIHQDSICRDYLAQEIIAQNHGNIIKEESGNKQTILMKIFSETQHEERVYFIKNEEIKQEIKEFKLINNEQNIKKLQRKQDPYLVVKSLKNIDGTPQGHILSIGQRIKLGRTQYLVIEMKINENIEILERNFSSLTDQTQYLDTHNQLQQDAVCRVCFCSEDTKQDLHNFLFSPCKCSGSSKYIHIKCLQNWILCGTAYYRFNKLECQICKYKLPRVFIKDQQTYQLLKVQRPQQNYLILQQTGHEEKKDLIVIKNISQLGINIGRDRNSEIRLYDSSVSRPHAKIIVKNERFVIFDSNSKFGTLVKLTKNFKIETNCAFQVGKTILQFSTKKSRIIEINQNYSQIEAPTL